MWVLYEKNTGHMVKSFHLKKKAKEYIKANYWRGADQAQLGLENVNVAKLEQWKVWKLLCK